MKRNFCKQTVVFLVVISAFLVLRQDCRADELYATPVYQAKPVSQHSGIGKFLGKTMDTVSHSTPALLPFLSKAKKSTDKGAPEPEHYGLFDPRRSESPIRTARLFTIRVTPVVAQPVAVPVHQ